MSRLMLKIRRNRVVSGLVIILVFVLILAAILFVRALSFSPTQTVVSDVVPKQVPPEAVTRLSQAIQIQTISALPDENLRHQHFQRPCYAL